MNKHTIGDSLAGQCARTPCEPRLFKNLAGGNLRFLSCPLIVAAMLFSASCGDKPKEAIPTHDNSEKNLLLYADYNDQGKEVWGYLDEDTGNVAIEATYELAYPFIGAFAVVRKTNTDRLFIIDKNERIVFSGKFDTISLIVSESGKNHLALLTNRYERTKLHISIDFLGVSGNTGFYKEEYYKNALINLADNKTIVREAENHLYYHIQCIGDYLLIDDSLYRFLDDGGVELVADDDRELAAGILNRYFEERGIKASASDYLTIDYSAASYTDATNVNPDLSVALGELKTLHPEFTLTLDKAYAFYRDHRLVLNAPLIVSEKKYLLSFKDEQGRHALGIYNETKAEWELLPLIKFDNSEELYYIADIAQTNNPKLYYLRIKTDSIGWEIIGAYMIVGGGVYDTERRGFIEHLYAGGNLLSMFYEVYSKRWTEVGEKYPGNGAYLFYNEHIKKK